MTAASPSPLLAGLVGAPGWRGPLSAEEVPAEIVDPVRLMTLNHWDRHAYFNQYVDRSSSTVWTVAGPELTEAYQGCCGGRDVVVANVRVFVSATAVADAYNGRTYETGAVAVSLPVALPIITVLRPIKSLFGRHGWRSGNAQFDKRFSGAGRTAHR